MKLNKKQVYPPNCDHCSLPADVAWEPRSPDKFIVCACFICWAKKGAKECVILKPMLKEAGNGKPKPI